jgi:hypothetical protein
MMLGRPMSATEPLSFDFIEDLYRFFDIAAVGR